MSADRVTGTVDPALPAPVAPMPASRARPSPEHGILRPAREPATPWYARDLVSAINTRLALQGVPVQVPSQAGAMWSGMLKRIGVRETSAPAQGAPQQTKPDRATPRSLKKVQFRYADLAHTYPIYTNTAPGTEHATRDRVECERAEFTAALSERPWTAPELISLYRVCCQAREEGVNVAVVKTLDQAKSWDSARSLDFSGAHLADAFAPVADLLAVPLGLHMLTLNTCALGNAALRELAHALRASASVEILSIADNNIKGDGWEPLGTLLRDGPIESLDASGNAFNKHSIAALLQGPCTLRSLRLDRCNLRTSAVEAIAERIRESGIRHLSLRQNRIAVLGADAVALALQDYHDVARPIISGAEAVNTTTGGSVYTNEPGAVVEALLAGTEDAAAAADRAERIAVLTERTRALQRSLNRAPRTSALLTLDLKSNQLRSGISPVAIALRRNRSLRVLNLCDNGLDESALALLCGALRYNTTLETLDMSHNPCCGPSLLGIVALREVLAIHPRLKRVFLGSTNLSSDGALALAECLPDANALVHIDLSNNHTMNVAALLALHAGLRRNTHIRCLDVSVPLGPEAMDTARAIYDACMRNTASALERASTPAAKRQATGPLRKSALAAALDVDDTRTGTRTSESTDATGADDDDDAAPSAAPAEAAESLVVDVPVSADSGAPSAPIQHANELLSEESAIFVRARSIGLGQNDSVQEPVHSAGDKSGDELLHDILAEDPPE